MRPRYIIGPDGTVYEAKKRKRGCLSKFILIMGILWVIGQFVSDEEEMLEDTAPEEQSSIMSETTYSEPVRDASESIEEEANDSEIATETAAYDLQEVNIDINDSLAESHRFAQTDADYAHYTYLDTLEVQPNGALHVTVTNDFETLSLADKTLILETANNIAKLAIFMKTQEDKSLYITAYNQAGDKVAQSEMMNVTEYQFD